MKNGQSAMVEQMKPGEIGKFETAEEAADRIHAENAVLRALMLDRAERQEHHRMIGDARSRLQKARKQRDEQAARAGKLEKALRDMELERGRLERRCLLLLAMLKKRRQDLAPDGR